MVPTKAPSSPAWQVIGAHQRRGESDVHRVKGEEKHTLDEVGIDEFKRTLTRKLPDMGIDPEALQYPDKSEQEADTCYVHVEGVLQNF